MKSQRYLVLLIAVVICAPSAQAALTVDITMNCTNRTLNLDVSGGMAQGLIEIGLRGTCDGLEETAFDEWKRTLNGGTGPIGWAEFLPDHDDPGFNCDDDKWVAFASVTDMDSGAVLDRDHCYMPFSPTAEEKVDLPFVQDDIANDLLVMNRFDSAHIVSEPDNDDCVDGPNEYLLESERKREAINDYFGVFGRKFLCSTSLTTPTPCPSCSPDPADASACDPNEPPPPENGDDLLFDAFDLTADRSCESHRLGLAQQGGVLPPCCDRDSDCFPDPNDPACENHKLSVAGLLCSRTVVTQLRMPGGTVLYVDPPYWFPYQRSGEAWDPTTQQPRAEVPFECWEFAVPKGGVAEPLPGVPNLCSNDPDRDLYPNNCDADDDGDIALDCLGRDGCNFVDNCQLEPNPSQSDEDGDGVGNACDLTLPLVYSADNWIALPLVSAYQTAQDLCDRLVPSNATATVARRDPVLGAYTTHVCNSGGSNSFALQTGQAVKVVILDPGNPDPDPAEPSIKLGSDIETVLEATHDPTFEVTLIPAGPGGAPTGDNWISLPFTTCLETAQDVCDSIGAAAITVARFDPAAQIIQTKLCGAPSDFPLVRGQGVKVVVSEATTWDYGTSAGWVDGAPSPADSCSP